MLVHEFNDAFQERLGTASAASAKYKASLQQVAANIKGKKITVMCGAGISTACGIPDFRSPHTGLYAKIQPRFPELTHPTQMFDIEFFRNNPKPFNTLVKELMPEIRRPSATHHFFRLLKDKGRSGPVAV